MQRIADLMLLLEQLNNLQGAQEAKAALLSSPVFRLYNTYDVSSMPNTSFAVCIFGLYGIIEPKPFWPLVVI